MIGLENELIELKQKMKKVEDGLMTQIKRMKDKEIDYIETDQKILSMITEHNEFITLNIGGKIYLVKLSTLGKIQDTLFYMLLFTYIKEGKKLPEPLFIDRSPVWFDLILEYLRTGVLKMTDYSKNQKAEILEELEYYGIDLFKKGKKNEIDIEWDQSLSKAGACTIDQNDKRSIRVHSTTCYSHFVTSKLFSNENFVIEIDSTVTQSDYYYYFGLINESYVTSSNCMCCNPSNCWFLKCDGGIYINSARHESSFAWNGSKVVLGMRVLLSEKQIYFYKDTPDNEKGPFSISSGNNFRVVCGHCNSGNGTITITTCYYI